MFLVHHVSYDASYTIDFVDVFDSHMVINTLSGNHIVLTSHHDQDCCEDVAFDFLEIPAQIIADLKGLSIQHTVIKALDGDEGGVLVSFETRTEDPIFGGYTWVKFVIPSHNIQNGYYSPNLELRVSIGDYEAVIHHLRFTDECFDR
jgi:hypothetical protein